MDWEFATIRFLQSFDHPAIVQFFQAVTSLGDVLFFLIALPFLWMEERKFAARMTIALLSCALLNLILKETFARPRPFILFPELQLSPASGYALPSGHSQTAFVFWGLLAYHFRKRWLTISAVVLVFLVGLSRSYLGVHYPTDVLAGWTIGAIFLWAFLHSYPPAAEQTAKSTPLQILLLLAPCVAVYWYRQELFVSLAGGMTGTGIGMFCAQRFPPPPRSTLGNQAWRCLLSVVGTLLLYFALKALVNNWQDRVTLRLLRYAMVMAWVTYLAPLLAGRLFRVR